MIFPFTVNNHIALASEMMGMRLRFNQQNHDLLKALLLEEVEKCRAEVTKLAGREINSGSSKQVAGLLYGEIGLKEKKKRGTRVVTTDEDALRELRVEQPKHKDILTALIKDRHIQKKLDSYVDFEIDEDGYIPYSANPAGTKTNRWAFAKSPRNRGFNVQTAPEVMRLMCDAPEGRIFLAPDLPQADARIVAWDAQCLSQIKLFNDPTKHYHLENCIGIKGLTREQVYAKGWKDNNLDLYKVGKRRGHAGNYREQAKKLAMDLECTVPEAQWFLDDYFRRASEILGWHKVLLSRIKRTGGLKTPYPFERFRICHKAWGELMLTGKIGAKTWNEVCAHIPQSAVADIINTGMERLWLEEPDVRFHKHDHDSYLASTPFNTFANVARSACNLLRVTLTLHGRPLEMEAEMKVGLNYGQLVKWEGEETLEDLKPKLEKASEIDVEKVRKGLYGYL